MSLLVQSLFIRLDYHLRVCSYKYLAAPTCVLGAEGIGGLETRLILKSQWENVCLHLSSSSLPLVTFFYMAVFLHALVGGSAWKICLTSTTF